MPLTPSHAAAAWPLHRLFPRLPVAALVAGSMAPDFEYLVELAPRNRDWHAMPGFVLCAIPVGVVTWALWRTAVRPALRAYLPPGLAAELPAPSRVASLEFLAAVVAVTLGALSHVAWDTFTHSGARGVRLVPLLERTVRLGALGEVPLFRVVQHASTAFGLAVIALWIWRWVASRPEAARAYPPGGAARAWRALFAIIAASAAGALLNALRAPPASRGTVEAALRNPDTIPVSLGYAAVGWMIGVSLALLALAAAHAVSRPSTAA